MAVIVLIAVVAAVVAINSAKAKEEAAYQEYVNGLTVAIEQNDAYVQEMLSTVSLAEQVVAETTNVWNEAIWNDVTIVNGQFAFDFNQAIGILYVGYATDGTIDELEEGLAHMEQGIVDLKGMPDELQANYELTYSIYIEAKPFVELAINPEGNYQSYSEGTQEMDGEISRAFDEYNVRKVVLSDIVDEAGSITDTENNY